MRVVRHSIFLPATPARVYFTYLDPVEHAAFTGGGEVTIAPLVGAQFSAFGGRITGRIIALTPDRQIVQTWRSFEWRPEDPDSILLLTLQPESAGTRLELLQAPAPEHLHDTLQENWPMRYLDPWRAALEDKGRK
jgi:activator of HSP90 ATPase